MNEEYYSPDKRFRISLGCNEFRMSHWVCNPTLEDLRENTTLFHADSMWDASGIKWSDDSLTVSFDMRKYPGFPINNYAVVIHLETLRAEVTREGQAMQEMDLRSLSGIFLN